MLSTILIYSIVKPSRRITEFKRRLTVFLELEESMFDRVNNSSDTVDAKKANRMEEGVRKCIRQKPTIIRFRGYVL
jgi:hypothetical protein